TFVGHVRRDAQRERRVHVAGVHTRGRDLGDRDLNALFDLRLRIVEGDDLGRRDDPDFTGILRRAQAQVRVQVARDGPEAEAEGATVAGTDRRGQVDRVVRVRGRGRQDQTTRVGVLTAGTTGEADGVRK